VFGFFNKARTEIGRVGGFGKLPALGDFVRTPSASAEMMAFERWLTHAMETGEARVGAAWKSAFAAGAPHAFVWSGTLEKKARGLLVGVVVPSTDSVGRSFPVVICAPVPLAAFGANTHLAPLVLHEFFQHAAAAAGRAARTRSQAEFHAQVSSVSPPSLDGVGAALARYGAWAKSRVASELWASVFGDDAERATRSALYLVVESTAAYRGQETPPLSLGLRVPLGTDTPSSAALWLDVVRSAAGWKTTLPTLFISLSAAPRALIQLGAEAPASVLADLYLPNADSSAVCDLTSATGKLPSELPSAVVRAVACTSLPDVVAELGK
jgi:type VI secretion system protein ImpM